MEQMITTTYILSLNIPIYSHNIITFQVPFLHFAVVWLGVTNSFWKAVVLGTLSPQFRLAARVLCLTLCCRHRRLPPELLGLDDDD